MKQLMTVLFMVCAATVLGASRVEVPSLPVPVRPLAEVETNVAFLAGTDSDNLWKLAIELDASVSNCVEVVLGTDADCDGALGVAEGGLCIGWDCGEWFWRDRWGGEVESVEGVAGSRRFDWSLRLNGDRSPRSLGGNVFSGAVAPTCFDPSWNMARIVSRGAESLNVDSRMSVDAFLLRIR